MSKKGRIRRENAELKEQIAKLTASKEAPPPVPKTRKTGRNRLQMEKNRTPEQLKHRNDLLVGENNRIREALIEYRSKYEALVNTLGQDIPARYAHFPRRKRERYGLQKVA